MYKINCENIGDVKKYIWHYRKGNNEYGPFTYEDIIEMVRAGEIGPDDYVLKFGNRKFVKVQEIQGLLDFAPGPEEKEPENAEKPELSEKELAVAKEETREELAPAFENNAVYIQKKHKKESSGQKLAIMAVASLGLGLTIWLLIQFF